MEFDPQSGLMKCPFCGNQQPVPEQAEARVEEVPFDEIARGKDLVRLSDQALEVECPGCGSVVQFVPPEVAGTCAFCAANIVAQPKAANPLIAPSGLLPFAVTKQQASAQLQQWLGSRWFAPNSLKQMSRPESFGGVYLPFWTFDADTQSHYTGQRGEYYWVTEEHTVMVDGRPRVQTRQVRHTRWHYASGVVVNQFDDVLVPATKALPEDRLSRLAPWDLPELKPYEPAFLSGFKAQRYQVEAPTGLERAKELMQPEILQTIRQDIGGDEQQIDQVSTRYWNVTLKHLLLPAWVGAYRFRNQVYQAIVNARTGEVQGDRPYSAAKIVLLVIAILLALLVAVVLFGER
jgi:ribosomal protein S27E